VQEFDKVTPPNPDGLGPYITPAGTSTVTVMAAAISGTAVAPQAVTLTLTIAQ
jgi:hypothetical protein